MFGATLSKKGSGSSVQTVAVNTAITSFYYAWTGATTVTVTGLPAGVNSSINTSALTVTISGTPTVVGTFNYTVTTVGGSPNVSKSGTITVTGTTVAVTGVSLSPTSSTITTSNGTVKLSATVSPTNATNKAVTWTSSNTSVATVSSSGLVTGVANGAATITVKTTDGSKTATCAITVNIGSTTVAVTGVTVSPTSSTITSAGGTVQLAATVAPTNATNKAVTWTSSNTSVATVSSSGLVTAVANGSATITVKTTDGSKTATSAITVSISVTPPAASTDMIGYATVSGDGYTTTTGGAGGVVTTVTTLAQLQTWATARENNTAPAILYISGKIASTSNVVVTIKHGANISIYGIGSTSELQNIGLNIRDYKNVIVRNMKLHEVFYPNDALTIDECQHVWVDHNELYSKIGTGITVDTYDGLLDIKNGSRYVTVSWNYFHHHMKCMLYGHTDNTSQQATDSQMRITMHHNWVSYTNSRNPSIRFGALHMFNNYFEEIDDYGLAARDGAHVRSENNHYNNVLLSMSTDKFPVSGLPNGYICQSGNSLTGSTGAAIISQTGCDFWTSSILPYSYTLDATANVAALVKANTGVGKVTNLKSGTIENIDQPKSQLSVYVYPNPVLTTATIELSLDIESDVNVAIYNMVGQLVNVLAKGIYPEGENEIAFSKDGLKPGMFILSVKAGSMEKQLKIIIK